MRESMLVTGGAGFIGSALIGKLLGQGGKTRITCVDNFDPYYPPETKRQNISGFLKNRNFALAEADIRDKNALERVFRETKPETVVHLAAKVGVRPSIEQPLIYSEVNIRGTLNMLELARANGVKNFVFASSSSVYGKGGNPPFAESQKPEPISPYGLTKLAGEEYCRLYSELYGINAACLRYFTVYGPRQRPDMAIHKFTRSIDRGEEIPVYGNGGSVRDYTFVGDAVAGTAAAIEWTGKNRNRFGVFNIGGSETIKLNSLVCLIENAVGKKAKIRRMPSQAGDMPVTYADISRARRLLGYEPKTAIEEGVRKFIGWYRLAGKFIEQREG